MPLNGTSGQDLGLVFHPKLPFGVLSNNTLSPNSLGWDWRLLTQRQKCQIFICPYVFSNYVHYVQEMLLSLPLYVGKTRDDCRQNSAVQTVAECYSSQRLQTWPLTAHLSVTGRKRWEVTGSWKRSRRGEKSNNVNYIELLQKSNISGSKIEASESEIKKPIKEAV